jgi:hypothetical protein
MKKGKSPRSNGFLVEFFTRSFDLIKKDLLLMVKESQCSINVLRSMNSTFICLIPKKRECHSFEDYQPISCYNLVYKLITKIIAIRIKLMLSEIIGEEQFGFLINRQIHDEVILAQEFIHSANRSKDKLALIN